VFTGVYWHIGIGQTPPVTNLKQLPKTPLHFENPRVGGSIPLCRVAPVSRSTGCAGATTPGHHVSAQATQIIF